MYMDDYKRWADADLEDADLTAELKEIAGKEEEIKERFAVWYCRPQRCAGRRFQPYEYLCCTPGNAGTGKLGENTGRQSTGCNQL